MELTDDIMYEAAVNKDTSFEGVFFTAVKTTGIFCRPTCTARKPKRENVEFLESIIGKLQLVVSCRQTYLPDTRLFVF